MNEIRRRVAMVAALIAAAVYLFYRAAYTLNLVGPYAMFVSVLLFVAEAYGCFLMFLYFFQIWRIVEPEPVPPLEGRTVDVFIPTYNEDPELLRGTISAALALDYPHETWVLDDGKRESVRELCEELGCRYVTRPNNMHAKAGNLNHALEITTGEFVVIFDADHVAERHFITRLLGYFADEKLAFVQTPHSFYNFDNYQAELNYRTKHYWEEGQLFYNCTQPGKNNWNGVSFCGSAAMFRRAALEDVGLVATETITEDMQTGLRLHARGWRSLFVNERLVAGQAAPDVTTFNTQRLRWGEGNLGIFAFDNPLTMKGLTLAQRLCYLGSMLSWTTGVQKLVLYVSPMLMLLTGVAPIRELTWTLGIITAVYLACVWTAVKVASNGYGNLLGIEFTHMACFWTQIRSTWRAIFNRKKTKFVVTSKRGSQSGKGNSLRRMIAPQCLYIAGSAASIAWAGSRYAMGLSNDLVGLIVCGTLLLVHSIFAWCVIRRALKPKCRRFSWRHPCSAHVAYRLVRDDGSVVAGQGVTKDLNERGVGILVFDELPDVDAVELVITAGGESVAIRGTIKLRSRIVDSRSARDGNVIGYRYGILFDEPTTAQLNTLWSMSTLYAVARQYESFHPKQYPNSPTALLDPGQPAIQLPVTVHTEDEGAIVGATETVDRATMTVLFDHGGMEEGTELDFDLSSPTGEITGTATVVRIDETKVGVRTMYLWTFRFTRFEEQSRGVLQSVLVKANDREGEGLVRLHPGKSPTPMGKPVAIAAGIAACVAVVVFGSFRFVERDDILLAHIAKTGEASRHERSRVDHILGDVRAARGVDEDRVLRLREALEALDRTDDANDIDEILAEADVRTVFALYQKAQSLEGLGRHVEAAPVYESLVPRLAEFPTRDLRAQVLLSVARNRANTGEADAALDAFEQLDEMGWLNDVARREYAGLLAANGEADDAIERLEQLNRTVDDRYLLASLYLGREDYDAARLEYEAVLAEEPDQIEARRRIGDLALWSRDYATASGWYRRALELDSNDSAAREGLAKSLLWTDRFTEAVVEWRTLLADDRDRREWWTFYLDAAAGADPVVLDATDHQLLRHLFANREREVRDLRYLARLSDALERAGESDAAATALGELVEHRPDDRRLRLRLADALGRIGRYDLADVHYGILLESPADRSDISSPPNRRARSIADRPRKQWP